MSSQAHYGGGHLNEISRVIQRLKADDPQSWYSEWKALGDQLVDMAGEANARGHRRTSSDRDLRASNYYRVADFFLEVDDARKADVYRAGVAAFRRGVATGQRAVEAVQVPCQGFSLNAYWCSPPHRVSDAQKTIVFIGGLDSTAEELYFTGYGLLERGYQILIVEGPGQGATLREHGLPSRRLTMRSSGPPPTTGSRHVPRSTLHASRSSA